MGEEEAARLAARAMPFVVATAREHGTALLGGNPGRPWPADHGGIILTWVFGPRGAGEALPEPLASLVTDPADEDALAAVLLAVRQWLEANPHSALIARALLGTGDGVTQDVHAGRDANIAGRDINYLYPGPSDSQVKLVDVTVVKPGRDSPGDRDGSPVLDVKVRNIGGQPAVLKRVTIHVHRSLRYGAYFGSMRLTPYRAIWIGATLPVSRTYDVAVPPPEAADRLDIPVDIDQEVLPGRADRFRIRLGMVPTFDAYAYLVTLELVYDEDDRTVTSVPVAVSFSGMAYVYSADQIRGEVTRFLEDVQKIRDAIDQELAARGLPAPDWAEAPPQDRNDLPGGLLSVDGNGDLRNSGGRGVWEVTDDFWDPALAVARHLNTFRHAYGELAEIITAADVMDDRLSGELPRARATLADFPRLCAEFQVPDRPARPDGPARDDGGPAPLNPPAALLRDLVRGDSDDGELRARMNSGDAETLRFLGHLTKSGHSLHEWLNHVSRDNAPNVAPAAELLDEFLRTNRPRDPKAFRVRYALARQREATDPAGGVAALLRLLDDECRAQGPEHLGTCALRRDIGNHLTDIGNWTAAAPILASVVDDQQRTLGPGHPDTLRARHQHAFCLGESGDIPAALDMLTELLDDIRRAQGPDSPDTLDTRHELARRRGEDGDPRGAAAAFAELIHDRVRIQGPDHRHTLMSRYNLARWHGESGDPATAVTEFQDVLADQERVLGPRHADVLKTRRALEHWRAVARERRRSTE